MRHFRFILVVLLLIPVLVSCKKVSGGKIVLDTDKVFFGQEGGSQTIYILKGGIGDLYIYNQTGTDLSKYEGFEGDSTHLKRDWIELEKVVEEETVGLEITVSENTSGVSREAWVYVSYWAGESSTTVKVYQE